MNCKEEQWRNEGAAYALRIAKEKGVEGLETDLRCRGMENKRVSCKGNAADISACEYNSAWICKHPKYKSIVLTSTMYGARPSGCPKVDEWNRRAGE